MTIEDHDWANRQKPFPHSHPMPRMRNNFCASCVDVVINRNNEEIRTTRGVYLPIEHVCARIRVYDLRGNLIKTEAL